MGDYSKESDTPKILGKIGFFFAKFISILPVVASIMVPMSLLLGGFIYFSYYIFLYPRIDIVNYYFLFGDEFPSTDFYVFLLVIEGLVFLLGLYIFLDALITMAIHKKRNSDHRIVQNRLYKYIRHPQNLGILLMCIPFILYIPGTNDIGIRSGDILS